MATTTVRGKVSRVFFDGRGAEVTETFEIKGKEINKRWAAWFSSEHGLNVGDTVEVSGLHEDKIDSWADRTTQETRYGVKRSLNRAQLVTAGPEQGQGGDSAHRVPDYPAQQIPQSQTGDYGNWSTAEIPSDQPPEPDIPEFHGEVPF